MNKNDMIVMVREAQAAAGLKVNAVSTLNSKTVAALEMMLADMTCECDNGECCGVCCGVCDCCSDEGEVEAATAAPTGPREKGMTRKQGIARLDELNYTGPTSYLMPTVRKIVAWAEANYPADAELPANVTNESNWA